MKNKKRDAGKKQLPLKRFNEGAHGGIIGRGKRLWGERLLGKLLNRGRNQERRTGEESPEWAAQKRSKPTK